MDTDQTKILLKDTVWTDEVLVEGTLAVNGHVRLTIRPGTTVRFAPGAKLVIYGTLDAIGTPEHMITFTSLAPVGEAGSWQGIDFRESVGAVSRVAYCQVEYAEIGISGHMTKAIVQDSRFHSNVVGLSGGTDFAVDVQSCLFEHNKRGLDFRHNQTASVTQSLIVNNRDYGIMLAGSSPGIRQNLIVSNNRAGVYCCNGARPDIRNNIVSRNSNGIHADKKASPTIVHNEIHANEIGIHMERMTFSLIEHNRVYDNQVGFRANYAAYPVIRYNDFANNKKNLVLGPKHSSSVSLNGPYDGREWIFLDGAGSMRLVLRDLNRGAHITIPQDGVIDVQRNWWGEQVVAEMKRKGGQGNIDSFEDAHDTPFVEFRGTIHQRDRFDFSNWAVSPVPGSGPQTFVGRYGYRPPIHVIR